MGVGNPLRRDDSVGVHVARRLKKTLRSEKTDVIECETVPENYLASIERMNPTHVLIVDAAQTGLDPGSFIFTEISEIQGLAISSHNIPLSVLGEYLEKSVGAKVAIIAIQTEKTEFGEGLTNRLRHSADRVTGILLKVLA